MKLFSWKNVIVMVLIIVTILLVLACKKESTDCKTVITVKKLSDTLQVIPYARVIIAPDYPDVRVEGKSDGSGQFSYTFKYEGILDVLCSKKIEGTPDSLFGRGVIRLVPGETTYKTIFVY